ncbi:MAG TPA: bifunctional UDP-N-acetylglucosamine diphosphorylase/glucosamine-1-phosphate N-acetyltransferase GlmU [Actinomycetota bacterium]|nr:bifunctional UDP-N-acetylglucosamine diphosphorylase/glucosamine-1-phosphate N-acetyltransferase GlmU [Actinomycetota bacterium]
MPNPTSKRSLTAVVLAAGKGKRLRSSTPKVLHPLCGRPALWWTIQNALVAKPQRIVIVVHHGADRVREEVASWGIRPEPVFVEQGEPLGTGHAVLAAESAVGRVDEVLVTGGDFDPVTPEHMRELLRVHRRTRSAGTILTTEVEEPGGYGRVVRDGTRLQQIVEGFDAPPELKAQKEVSLLVFAFRRADLYRALPLVGRENSQHEYYLNEVFPILMDKGERISAVKVDVGGVMGINSRADLARSVRIVRERINDRHLANGVTLVDPDTTYIDVDVRIGADSVILPNTHLEGSTRIGVGCEIGPSTRIVDSRIDDETSVTFAVVRGARIGRGSDVGPYVSIRPGTVLGEGAKAGTFVEIKNSKVGRGSKVPHLSYVGDADIGAEVNIGAANVFANYDGYEKHRTSIGDGARTGSDTILVAPVRLGKGAVTGAGSVITKDVPPGALAVERSDQRIVKGYRKRKDDEARARREGRGAH